MDFFKSQEPSLAKYNDLKVKPKQLTPLLMRSQVEDFKKLMQSSLNFLNIKGLFLSNLMTLKCKQVTLLLMH